MNRFSRVNEDYQPEPLAREDKVEQMYRRKGDDLFEAEEDARREDDDPYIDEVM